MHGQGRVSTFNFLINESLAALGYTHHILYTGVDRRAAGTLSPLHGKHEGTPCEGEITIPVTMPVTMAFPEDGK